MERIFTNTCVGKRIFSSKLGFSYDKLLYRKWLMDMRVNLFIVLLISFIGLWGTVAQAVEVHGIDTANIVVQDHSRQSLRKALPQALEQVLVKVSGNPDVITLPTVQNALPKIDNLVESYSYTERTNASGEQELNLQVVFDNDAIKHLLRDAGQAIWGNNRPLTLVWLSVPEEMQTRILSNDSENPLVASVKHFVEQRGIPIIFPSMDLEDRMNMNLSASRLPSREQLEKVARRYGVESVLVANVVSVNHGELIGEWELFLKGTPIEWQTSGTDINQVVINGVDRAVDMMVNRLATIESKSMQSSVAMKITGVKNLNDYVHVVATLRQLAPITQVMVNDMSHNTLQLVVHTVSGKEGLIKALENVPLLTAETTSSTAADSVQEDLFYHWGKPQTQVQTKNQAQAQSTSGTANNAIQSLAPNSSNVNGVMRDNTITPAR